jgi:hypothetical protein
MDAAKGEADEGARAIAIVNRHMSSIIGLLTGRLIAWNWTDDDSQPMPQPKGNPDVLTQLRADELVWLVTVSQGESPTERKNGSRPSETTSSAIALPATAARKSTGGRSHTPRP